MKCLKETWGSLIKKTTDKSQNIPHGCRPNQNLPNSQQQAISKIKIHQMDNPEGQQQQKHKVKETSKAKEALEERISKTKSFFVIAAFIIIYLAVGLYINFVYLKPQIIQGPTIPYHMPHSNEIIKETSIQYVYKHLFGPHQKFNASYTIFQNNTQEGLSTPPYGIVIMTDRETGTTVKALNSKTFIYEFDVQKLIAYLHQKYPDQVKRLLAEVNSEKQNFSEDSQEKSLEQQSQTTKQFESQVNELNFKNALSQALQQNQQDIHIQLRKTLSATSNSQGHYQLQGTESSRKDTRLLSELQGRLLRSFRKAFRSIVRATVHAIVHPVKAIINLLQDDKKIKCDHVIVVPQPPPSPNPPPTPTPPPPPPPSPPIIIPPQPKPPVNPTPTPIPPQKIQTTPSQPCDPTNKSCNCTTASSTSTNTVTLLANTPATATSVVTITQKTLDSAIQCTVKNSVRTCPVSQWTDPNTPFLLTQQSKIMIKTAVPNTVVVSTIKSQASVSVTQCITTNNSSSNSSSNQTNNQTNSTSNSSENSTNPVNSTNGSDGSTANTNQPGNNNSGSNGDSIISSNQPNSTSNANSNSSGGGNQLTSNQPVSNQATNRNLLTTDQPSNTQSSNQG